MPEALTYVVGQIVRTGSGRVHERARVHGRWLTDERCNLDDVARLEILTQNQISDLEELALCGFCFPTGGMMGTEQSQTSTAPDGDVVTTTDATSQTATTQTKTEPAAPDRSNTVPATPDRSKGVEPNKKG